MFIYDDSPLPNWPKSNWSLRPEIPANQKISGGDWNSIAQALTDVKTFCRGASWLGLSGQGADPAPAGVAEYLYLDEATGLVRVRSGALGLGSLAYRNTAAAGSFTNASLTIDSLGRITAASSSTGSVPGSGWFGPGLDGVATLDGSTTVLGMVPVAGVYTATRDLAFSTLTINNGVTLFMANWALMVSGTLTNNGTIHNNGNAGTTNTNTGRATPDGRWKATVAAAYQNTGFSATNVPKYFFIAGAGGVANGGGGHAGAGDGGAGGIDNAGNGGFHGGSTTLCTPVQIVTLEDLWRGYLATWNSAPAIVVALLQFGAAGGSGGLHAFAGDAGGGGAGGGMCWVAARTVTGVGAIRARGGASAAGGGPGGSGGGGGGGMAVFIYGTQSGQTVDANGGLAAAVTNGGGKGGDGGSGAVYRVNLSGDGT